MIGIRSQACQHVSNKHLHQISSRTKKPRLFQQCSNILFFHRKVFPIKMVLVSAAVCDRLSTHFTITYLIKFNTRIIRSAVKNTKWCQAKYFLCTIPHKVKSSQWLLFLAYFLLTSVYYEENAVWLVSNLWSISVMPPQRGIHANKQHIFFRQ